LGMNNPRLGLLWVVDNLSAFGQIPLRHWSFLLTGKTNWKVIIIIIIIMCCNLRAQEYF
jgi:hypothetical protein